MRIICAGEAMAELRPLSGGGFATGFAGDTFNTAVYLRRLWAGSVGYVTRIGRDPLSEGFLASARAEGIDLGGVVRDMSRNLGIYALQVDATGERSFFYWRDRSAARLLFQDEGDLTALEGADVLFLSGITLAILSPDARTALIGRLAVLRARGMRLAFDSNYRPLLWEDADTARAVIGAMWRLTDFALPSVDDEMALFGDQDAGAVLARLRSWGCREGALKCGAAGPLPMDPGAAVPSGLNAEGTVVDTTAAGDGFNAGWLAARLMGRTGAEAMTLGHRVALRVVAQPGAIVDLGDIAA